MKDLILNTILVISIVCLVGVTLYNNYSRNITDNNESNTQEPEQSAIIIEENDIKIEETDIEPEESVPTEPDNIILSGHWDDRIYINDKLGFMINVPNGWTISKGSIFIHLSEFKTGNFVELNLHKYTTAEERRKYENSQGKPRGINYREDEILDSEELAGAQYLTLKYKIIHIELGEDDEGNEVVVSRDVNNVAYKEEHYYRDIVWDDNDWILGDDSIEIRCRICDDSNFDLRKIITKIDQ